MPKVLTRSALIAVSLWLGGPALGQAGVEPLRVEPKRVEAGRVAPGEMVRFAVRIVNDTHEAVGLLSVRPNCPCTKTANFQPTKVEPGESYTLEMAITAPAEVGKRQGVTVFVVTNIGQALMFEVSISSADPREITVERFLDTKQEWGIAVARRYVNLDARTWFGSREGEGRPFFNEGKWADWDKFFNASWQQQRITIEGDEIVVVSYENNDFYRLIDRAPARGESHYWFDGQNRIMGHLLIMDQSVEKTDRLDEFKVWLTDRDAEALAWLMPEGEFDPTIEKAKRWKELLIEWRREAQLPELVLADSPK